MCRYREALRAAGDVAITQPRLDPVRNALVVTVSHAVFDDVDPEVTLGVSAMDLPYSRFASIVDDLAQCSGSAGRECFVLDEEARFVTPLQSDTQAQTVGELIVTYLPTLALKLIDEGLLQRVAVPDYRSATVCTSWKLALPSNATLEEGLLQLELYGGCPTARVWFSKIERKASEGAPDSDAAAQLTAGSAPALFMLVLGMDSMHRLNR